MAGRAYRRGTCGQEPVLVGPVPGKTGPVDEAPQLSSIASALTELTDRVAVIAESAAGTDREDVAAALYEVERALRTGSRRLDDVLRALD